jgi:acyl carrier protein
LPSLQAATAKPIKRKEAFPSESDAGTLTFQRTRIKRLGLECTGAPPLFQTNHSRSKFCTFDQTRDLRQDRGSFMTDADLRTRIKEMLVKNLMLQVTTEQIGDDLPLFGPNGLGLDSIDALELVVSMEKTFGVGVPSSEVAGKALQTVNTIHDYILEKREAAA